MPRPAPPASGQSTLIPLLQLFDSQDPPKCQKIKEIIRFYKHVRDFLGHGPGPRNGPAPASESTGSQKYNYFLILINFFNFPNFLISSNFLRDFNFFNSFNFPAPDSHPLPLPHAFADAFMTRL